MDICMTEKKEAKFMFNNVNYFIEENNKQFISECGKFIIPMADDGFPLLSQRTAVEVQA
jgi:hypothetical protein